MTADSEMNEFERQRMELMERNKQRMKELNLQFMLGAQRKPSKAAAPKPPRAPKQVPRGPVRQSARVLGASVPEGEAKLPDVYAEGDDDDDWLEDDEEWGRRKMPREKSYTGAREFDLPPAFDKDGNQLPRRRSCHICTQCPASWRGNFSMPLACTTCPLIFCSRCLFHINGADDISEAHDFIDEHQGSWQCFMCTGTCACQDPKLQRLSKMDRHKARGWVGVTGGFTAAPKRPTSRRKRATKQPVRVSQAGDSSSGAVDSEADTVSIPDGWMGTSAKGGEDEACAESARKDVHCCSRSRCEHGSSCPEDSAGIPEGSSLEERALSSALSPAGSDPGRKLGEDLTPSKHKALRKLETPPQAPPTRPRRASIENAGTKEARALEGATRRSARQAQRASRAVGRKAGGVKKKTTAKLRIGKENGAAGWTGTDALGKRVRAYWAAEDQWFDGTIGEYEKSTNTHKIIYDDDDYEYVQLPDETILFI